MQKRLVIYTCLTGDREGLGDPLRKLEKNDTDLAIDFVCLTDNPHRESKTWRLVKFDNLGLPPEKSSRLPKSKPHLFFPQYQYSLYIDNIVHLKRLPNSSDLSTQEQYLFRVFKHSGRNSVVDEALAICDLGYDTAEVLIRQLEHYAGYMPLSEINPLSTCTVILREHNLQPICCFGDYWWAQILAFSKRDQMSFDFCRLLTKTKVQYFGGTKFENDLVYAQENFSQLRRLANFDEKRGRWLVERASSGDFPGGGVGEKIDLSDAGCVRFTDRLDLLFYLCGSPMGSAVSPRMRLSWQISKCLDRAYHDVSCGSGLSIFSNSRLQGIGLTRGQFEATCSALKLYLKVPLMGVAHELADFTGGLGDIPDSARNGKRLDFIFMANVTGEGILNTLMYFHKCGVKFGRSLVILAVSADELTVEQLGKINSCMITLFGGETHSFETMRSDHDGCMLSDRLHMVMWNFCIYEI